MLSRDFFIKDVSGVHRDCIDPFPGIGFQFDPACDAPELIEAPGFHLFRMGLAWQYLRAGYCPFAVTQHFVQSFLSFRPDRVVIDSLNCVSADLARISRALGIETAVVLTNASMLQFSSVLEQRWNRGLLSCISYLVCADPHVPSTLAQQYPDLPLEVLPELPLNSRESSRERGFGYEAYAFGMRDHDLLTAMQAHQVSYFEGCKRVLDVGCGTGVFLECLNRQGISAMGVERNLQSAQYCKSLGLDVQVQDGLDYLEGHTGTFDGIYCSHFVEHLPFDAVERLVKLVSRALMPDGLAVFVFPDPESIRSQLLGFWRDPEHVRFYHPEILSVLGSVHGLQLVHNSQAVAGRKVVPFSMSPSLAADLQITEKHASPGLWQRALKVLGIAHISDLEHERRMSAQLVSTVQQLWDVNQTWAWEDNVTLQFRKIASN